MAIEGVYRYGDLIKSIVSGSFYASKGVITPFRSGETNLRLETPAPNSVFGIYLNEAFSGQVSSDSQGNVEFSRVLPLGDVEVTLVENSSGNKYSSWLTVRSYATWLAAYATIFERIDDNIQEVRDNLAVMTATVNGAEAAFGKYVNTYNNMDQSINDYVMLLHELRLAYRNQGGTFGGLDQAISVFTQVPPFGISRRYWGPNWWLDHNFLSNHRFLDRSHDVDWDTTSIDGVTLIKVEPDVTPVNIHSLTYNSSTDNFVWTPAGAPIPNVVKAKDGEIFIPGASSGSAKILGSIVEPFSIVSGVSDKLYIDIDDVGDVIITLNVGLPTPSASDIIGVVNAAFVADTRYSGVYSSVASDVDGRVKIQSPIVGGGSIKIRHGLNSGGVNIFGGPVNATKDIWSGIRFVEATAEAIDVDGELDYEYDGNNNTRRFRYKSPNKTFGAWVNIERSGPHTLIDGSGYLLTVDVDFDALLNLLPPWPRIFTLDISFTYSKFVEQIKYERGIWIDVDSSSLPSGITTENISVRDDSSFGNIESPDYWRVLNPAVGTVTSFNTSSVITSKINDDDPSSAFQFRITSASTGEFITAKILKFNAPGPDDKRKLYPINDPAGIYDYEGFEVTLSGWVKNYTTSIIDVNLGFNWDGITTTSSPVMTVAPGNTDGDYPAQYVTWTTVIPNNLVRNKAEIEIYLSNQSGTLDATLDAFSVEVNNISSRNLAAITVPRSRHNQYFGNLLWTWSPDPMSLIEKEYIGIQHKSPDVTVPFPGVEITNITLDTPAGQGNIELSYSGTTTRLRWNSFNNVWTGSNGYVSIIGDDVYVLLSPAGDSVTVNVLTGSLPPIDSSRYITISDITKKQGNARRISPAQSKIDVFDVTEYDSNGLPINLAGAVGEGDFSDGTLQNLEINSATPFKFAYLTPSSTGVSGELLSFDGVTRLANLSLESDQDQDNALLFQDDVLVPNDRWQFNSSQEIEIPDPANFHAGALYVIDYNLLYRFTSDIIVLPTNLADYIWYSDYYTWVRLESEAGEYENMVPLFFNPDNGRAVLSNRSNMDMSTASLYRDTDNEQIEVAQRYWRFVSNKTVELDASELIGGAQYFLQHDELRAYERNNLNITFEHKHGADSTTLAAASWDAVNRNENIDIGNGDAYHQLRISVQGIRDIRDFRIRSVVLKGLHIFGSNPNVPGITNLRR